MYFENSKLIIRLDSFSKLFLNIWVIFGFISVFETTVLDLPNYSIFLRLLSPALIVSLMRF